MQAILSGFNMTESGDLAVAEESYVGRWPGLADPTDVCSQKAWDMPCALAVRDKMLAEADQVDRARLLAAGCRESGVWLGVVPVLSLGTQLDPEVLRIGIALRLGAKLCEGHRCRCGCNIDEKGYHSPTVLSIQCWSLPPSCGTERCYQTFPPASRPSMCSGVSGIG